MSKGDKDSRTRDWQKRRREHERIFAKPSAIVQKSKTVEFSKGLADMSAIKPEEWVRNQIIQDLNNNQQ